MQLYKYAFDKKFHEWFITAIPNKKYIMSRPLFSVTDIISTVIDHTCWSMYILAKIPSNS